MEATQPRMWDGENLGGKLLMKLRDEFSANHSWVSTSEEEEAKKQFNEKKRTIWQTDRRSQQFKGRAGANVSDRGGKRGGKRVSRGGGAPGARSNPTSLFGADPLTSSAYFGGDGYTTLDDNQFDNLEMVKKGDHPGAISIHAEQCYIFYVFDGNYSMRKYVKFHIVRSDNCYIFRSFIADVL
uniref:Uncharacterized protein n=1 Tax=Romanomermis culicivorax TaxID=13658 RepID=A0A915L9Q1_ROMCU